MTRGKVSGMAERILVVDDDESMRKMLEIFLAKEGYSVDAVDGLGTAAQVLELNDYRIILIDKNMPGIDGNFEGGFDLLRLVRSRSPCSSVIMMTGNPSLETAARAAEFGVECFMAKPFSLTTLRQKIEALLNGAERVSC